MRVHRLQSPFEHWVSGLLVELGVFFLYLVTLGVLVAFTLWLE